MKKTYLICLIVLSLKLQGQIQITQTHMPSIGDTIRYSVSNSTTLNYKQTGANYAWDYKTLNMSSQDLYRFQALLSTPYSTLAFTGMPLGAIGYKIADSIGSGQAAFKNLYNFYDKKSTGWSAVGTGFTLAALPLPAGGVYKDKDEIYTFPLNYNDQDSTTFEVSTPLGNQFLQLGTFKQKGYRINKVEGWGTISTPYANNVSCLKIKSRVVETDSLKVSSLSLNVGFQANRVEYRWLSTGEKIPLLEVTGTEIAGVFTPGSIRFRDNYRAPNALPFSPRARFTVNRNSGIAGQDTFAFSNLSTPAFGNTYIWTITPSAGVRYISASSGTSKDPDVLFDSAGVYTVKLQTSNFAGTDDSTAFNMITVTKKNTQSLSPSLLSGTGIYPNPVQNSISFTDAALTGKICHLFDSEGRLILEITIPADLKLDLSALGSGNYSMLITGQETFILTQFIKI